MWNTGTDFLFFKAIFRCYIRGTYLRALRSFPYCATPCQHPYTNPASCDTSYFCLFLDSKAQHSNAFNSLLMNQQDCQTFTAGSSNPVLLGSYLYRGSPYWSDSFWVSWCTLTMDDHSASISAQFGLCTCFFMLPWSKPTPSNISSSPIYIYPHMVISLL